MLLAMLERGVDATREWGVEAVLIGAVLVKLAAPAMPGTVEHSAVHERRVVHVSSRALARAHAVTYTITATR